LSEPKALKKKNTVYTSEYEKWKGSKKDENDEIKIHFLFKTLFSFQSGSSFPVTKSVSIRKPAFHFSTRKSKLAETQGWNAVETVCGYDARL
jgi:hypothetical protein